MIKYKDMQQRTLILVTVSAYIHTLTPSHLLFFALSFSSSLFHPLFRTPFIHLKYYRHNADVEIEDSFNGHPIDYGKLLGIIPSFSPPTPTHVRVYNSKDKNGNSPKLEMWDIPKIEKYPFTHMQARTYAYSHTYPCDYPDTRCTHTRMYT